MSESLFQYLQPHPCMLDHDVLMQQCEIKFTRRGGPGGQHRNKTQTAVVLTHRSTGICGEASERRSQNQNREVAIHRLRMALALSVRTLRLNENTVIELQDPMYILWEQRILGATQMISANHWDFPTIIAFMVDQMVKSTFEMSATSHQLGISTGQLSKLIRQDPTVLAWVNQLRETHNLGRIR